MKAAVYYAPDNIAVENLPEPRIGSQEILVHMKACGLCGSDLMEWYLKSRAPLVLGHEPAGIIAKVGSKVVGYEVGEQVFAHHHVACLTCNFCRKGAFTLCPRFKRTNLEPGGFAEYFKVPEPNLKVDTISLPPQVSLEEATLIEPLGCCLRALKNCQVNPSDTTVILGAGPSGIIFTTLLRNLLASQIIVADFIEFRLKAAEHMGADFTVNPGKDSLLDAVKTSTNGHGADLVIVTTPNINGYLTGIELCRRGGTLCAFAPTQPEEFLRLSPNKLLFSEIKLVSSYSTSHIETRTALNLIKNKRIDSQQLITHKFPLENISEAFKVAATKKDCIKVIVTNEE